MVEGASASAPASPGEPLHVKQGINARLNLLARSAGGGSNGIAIALGGDAIRRGLITVPAVTFRGASSPTLERQEPDGAWMIAELPNVGLPVSGLVNEQGEVVSTDYHPPVRLALVVEAGHPGEGVLRRSVARSRSRGAFKTTTIALQMLSVMATR